MMKKILQSIEPFITTSEFAQIFLVPTVVLFIHTFLGLVVRIYNFWPWFDMPMHFLGGVSIAIGSWVFFRILERKGFTRNIPVLLRLFFILSFVALSAVGWEIIEFIGDRLFAEDMQESAFDTMIDLILGLSGGLVVGIIVHLFGKKI